MGFSSMNTHKAFLFLGFPFPIAAFRSLAVYIFGKGEELHSPTLYALNVLYCLNRACIASSNIMELGSGGSYPVSNVTQSHVSCEFPSVSL